MTSKDHNSVSRHCGGDVAAYALGALDAAETESFRAHLHACAVCRDELFAFQDVVDVLALSVPRHRVPKRLRRRTLDAVEQGFAGEPPPRRNVLFAKLSLPRMALVLGIAVAILAVAVGGESNMRQTTKTSVFAAQVTGPGSAEVRITGGHAELVVHHFPPPPAGQVYQVWLGRSGHPLAPTTALFSVNADG